MKNKPNYTELVHKYLANELSAEQLNEFKAELKNNKLLRQELSLQKKLDDFILDDELENFKLGLDEVYDDLIKRKPKTRRLNVSKISLIAASILILISLSVLFFNSEDSILSGDEIFSEYYEGYPSSYNSRTGEVCLKDSRFQIAFEQYKNKDYKKAKISFLTVCENYPNNVASKFYLGIVDIELGEFEGAIGYFDKVIKSKDQYYTEQSEWHKSLCLLKLGSKSEAVKQLSSIAEQKGFYHEKAEEILLLLE